MTYCRAHPSPRYLELIELHRQLHTAGEKLLRLPPEQTFVGQSLLPQVSRIKNLIACTASKTILDYGSGKGFQYRPLRLTDGKGGEWQSVQNYWGVDKIRCYDPCYEQFNKLPDEQFDGVVCTDVLEHCPEEDIPWMLDEIFGFATCFVFATIACYPAKKHLPNGANAHCTIQPLSWWRAILKETSTRYPDVKYEIWVRSSLKRLSLKRLRRTKPDVKYDVGTQPLLKRLRLSLKRLLWSTQWIEHRLTNF